MYKFIRNLLKYRSVILGDVRIEPNVSIRYSIIKGNINIKSGSTIYRVNLFGKIRVGKNTSITGPFTYVHSVTEEILIGDRCAIAPINNSNERA